MNKFLHKVIGAALGLAMAVGVGIAVSGAKDAARVDAAYSALYSADFTSVSTHSYTQNKTFSLSEKSWTASVSQVNGSVFYLGCNKNNSSKGVLGDNSTFSDVDAALVETGTTYTSGESQAYALLFENSYSDVTKIEFAWSGGNNAFQVYLFGDSGSGFTQLGYTDYSTSGTSVSGSVTWTGNATSFSKFAIAAKPGTATTNATNKTLRASSFTLYETEAVTQTITASADSAYYDGGSITLTTNASSANWTITANTADASLSASSGQSIAVTATQAGSVTVQAASDGYTTVTKTLTFEEKPTDPYITPEKSSTSGYSGANESLSFTYGNLDSSLAVSSSNTSVVTVETPSYSDGSGTVQINFVAAGSTTVKFKDGSSELASVDVTVTASSVSITGLASSDSVYIGKTLDLGSTITVTNVGSYSTDVTWSSDDGNVATVDSSGVVTGVAEGSATITVTSDDYPSATMSCAVSVSEEPTIVTFTPTSTTAASVSGTNPTSAYTFASTYSNSNQLTNGNNHTLTLNLSRGIVVTKIVMSMKSNASSGAGGLKYSVDGGDYVDIIASGTAFNAFGDSTAYGTTYKDVITLSGASIEADSTFVLNLYATTNSIYCESYQIYFDYQEVDIVSNLSSFEVNKSSSKGIELTVANFSATPTITYSITSGTSYISSITGYDSITNNVATVTITASATAGNAVIRFTATNSTEVDYVDVSVSVIEPKTISSLDIVTAGTTNFTEGDSFAVGSLVLRATFSDNSTTDYSAAIDNLSLLTFDPAIGDVLETTDTYVTVYVTEYGDGEFTGYNITVAALVWYNKITAVSQLYDGQTVVIGNSEETRIAKTYESGNNIPNESATFDTTNHKISEANITSENIYTIGRLYVDSATVYTFKDSSGNYLYSAGGTSNNYLKTTGTIGSTCYWNITIADGVFSIINVGNNDSGARNVMCWNGSTFANYKELGSYKTVVLYAIDTTAAASTVAAAFESGRMYMSTYDADHSDSNQGLCTTYYPLAKQAWNAMSTDERSAVSSDAKARLQAWAVANGDTFDGGTGALSAKVVTPFASNSTTSLVAIVALISLISVSSITGFYFLRKRKEQE